MAIVVKLNYRASAGLEEGPRIEDLDFSNEAELKGWCEGMDYRIDGEKIFDTDLQLYVGTIHIAEEA